MKKWERDNLELEVSVAQGIRKSLWPYCPDKLFHRMKNKLIRALAEKMSASALILLISGAMEHSYFVFAPGRLEKHKNYLFCILDGASQPRSIVYAPP